MLILRLGLPQRRRDRRLPHRRPHRRRLRDPAAGPAVLHRHARAQPPRTAPPRRARARTRAAHRASPPAGPPSSNATPSCSARSPSSSWPCSPCPRSRLRLGTSDQGNDPTADDHPPGLRPASPTGFGPGVNGPLTLVTQVDGAEDRLALDNLDATLRATEGVAAVTPVTYNTRRRHRVPHRRTGVLPAVPARPATSSTGCAPRCCRAPRPAPRSTCTSAG